MLETVVEEQLADPKLVCLFLDNGRRLRHWRGALMRYLACQQRFHRVNWLGVSQRQCEESVSVFRETLRRTGDARQIEDMDARHRLTLRDSNGTRWSFHFIVGDRRRMRGLGGSDALCVVEHYSLDFHDPWWLPYVANGCKFLWCTAPPEGAISPQLAPFCTVLTI